MDKDVPHGMSWWQGPQQILSILKMLTVNSWAGIPCLSGLLYSLRFLGVSVAKMGGEFSPLSALKRVSELPEPGPAVSMAKDFFLCDGHS